MTDLTPNQTNAEPQTIELSVDRSRAMIAGFWRLGLAAVLIAAVIIWDVPWPRWWATDKATCAALATIHLALAGAALWFLISASRWLALSLWTGSTGVTLSESGLSLLLGPFGRYKFDRRRLHIAPDRPIDPELMEFMPDDAFVVVIRHPEAPGDLARQIQRYTGVHSERFTALMRPFLTRE